MIHTVSMQKTLSANKQLERVPAFMSHIEKKVMDYQNDTGQAMSNTACTSLVMPLAT